MNLLPRPATRVRYIQRCVITEYIIMISYTVLDKKGLLAEMLLIELYLFGATYTALT